MLYQKKKYENNNINGSINLPVDTINEKNRDKILLSFIKKNMKNYKLLNDLIKDKKLNIKDIPIIIYCENLKCKASENLLSHFINVGFTNVLEYSF